MKRYKLVVSTMSATRRAGGLFNSVRNLSTCLNTDFDLVVIAGRDENEKKDIRLWGQLNLKLLTKFKPYSFGFMPSGLNMILKENPDILHCHGVWSYNALICLLAKILRPRILLIVSPRGMLDEWALSNSKWKKILATKLYVRRLIRHSDFVHALCSAEARSIKNFDADADVFTLPNGVNRTDSKEKCSKSEATKNIIGYIGRLHPKKGLENLILAFKHLERDTYHLKIAGNGTQSYTDKLQDLIIKNKLEQQIQLVGAKYGPEKLHFLHDCDVTILPSFSEGLPMSVLDSWVQGIPTMITKECNFDEFGKEKFAIPIKADPTDIKNSIIHFFSQEAGYIELLGREAREHVLEHYSWELIANKYTKLVTDELRKHNI